MTSTSIRRHGYHLMSLASLGIVVCFFAWVLMLMATWGVIGKETLFASDLERWVLTAGASAALLAQAWAMSRLRAVGRVLHFHPVVSVEMALAWKRFARALVAVSLVMLVTPSFIDAEVKYEVDFTELYFMLIACLCTYSIAWLLQDAAALKAENEGFV